jgi:uncharacterized RDD family membrane protein YckC
VPYASIHTKRRASPVLNQRAPNPIATLPLARPDAAVTPDMLDGVLWRRIVAYLADLVVVGIAAVVLAIVLLIPATILSLGLLTGPMIALFGLLPLAYHILLVGGPQASTLGQRMMDLRVMDSTTGDKPDYAQAGVQCVLFYVTLALTGFLLLFVFFNPHRRTLHDWASGTVVVRRGSAR